MASFDTPCMLADRVDALAEQLEADGPIDRRKLRRRLAYLRRRSHVLDAAVMMGTLGGVATSCAALLLFVGTLRDRPGVSLFVAFGLALLFTMGALVAFLIEMLLASRGLRDQANYANEVGEMHELAAEGSSRAELVASRVRHIDMRRVGVVMSPPCRNPSRATATIECGHPASHR